MSSNQSSYSYGPVSEHMAEGEALLGAGNQLMNNGRSADAKKKFEAALQMIESCKDPGIEILKEDIIAALNKV